MVSQTVTIQFLGLPGAGKKRLKQALQVYIDRRTGDSEQKIDISVPEFSALASGTSIEGRYDLNWLVIDSRSFLEATDPQQQKALAYLEQLLSHCDAVVWMFAESSELTVQSQWRQWLRQWSSTQQTVLPSVQCFSQTFKFPHQGIEGLLQCAPSSLQQPLPPLSTFHSFHFQLPKVSLEHLLFVLDSSRQNLQMDVWRVKGCVITQEYVNPVAIEGTINRWDTYASELPENAPEMGHLIIEGLNLDRDLLQSLLQAAIAQGESNSVRLVDKR